MKSLRFMLRSGNAIFLGRVIAHGLIAFCAIIAFFVSCEPNRRYQQNRNLADTQHGLRIIGEAITEARGTNGVMPLKTDGLLSWRVHLLPFLGEAELYRRFHLDEPWDSENNKKLVPQIPRAYKTAFPSSQSSARGKTCYAAVIGNMALSENDHSPHIAIVVQVEPSAAVTWTKPDDWEYDSRDPLRHLYVHFTHNIYVLAFNGDVWAVPIDGNAHDYDRLFVYASARETPEPFGTRVRFIKAKEKG